MSGRINVYTCKKCGHQMVTIDRDEGVTPFMEICEKCKGEMFSAFYHCPQSLKPTHEWYKPTIEELQKNYPQPNVLSSMIEHVESGGLDLRKIDEEKFEKSLIDELLANCEPDKLIKMDSSSNACGGPDACEDKTFNFDDENCKKCLKDCQDAIDELNNHNIN